MKNIRLFTAIFVITAILSTLCFAAKNKKAELYSTDTLEYVLLEEEMLTATLLVEDDGLLTLKLTELSSSVIETPKIKITLYDGKDIISELEVKYREFDDNGFDSGRFCMITGITEGEYKLVVENLRDFTDVSFKIETSFTQDINTESTSGNSFENATEMALSEKYYGGVTQQNERDYFSFDMPYDGYVYIEMYSPETKLFSLYDKDRNEIGSIDVAIDEEDKVYSHRSGLAKGRYYISVRPYEDYSYPLYSLEVKAYGNDSFNFEKEYNNEKAFAEAIDFGKEYQGNLFGIEDEDVFTFTLEDTCKTVIDFYDTHVSKGGHYSIWLSDGKNVIFSTDDSGRETIELDLSKGTYYFTVSSLGKYSATGLAYKFKIAAHNTGSSDIEEKQDEETKEEIKEEITEEIEDGQFGDESLYQFSDVYDSDWYAEDLLNARKQGLIEGIGDNLYTPKGNVTLAEAIAMAARAYNILGGSNTVISHGGITVGKWYNTYITFAVNAGIIKRDDFDDFERPATRAEMAYIFANIIDGKAQESFSIPDVDENTPYYSSIHKLYALEILKGDDEKGTFYPDRNITRAEAAVILLRVYNSK